jgi:hypothetical protein
MNPWIESHMRRITEFCIHVATLPARSTPNSPLRRPPPSSDKPSPRDSADLSTPAAAAGRLIAADDGAVSEDITVGLSEAALEALTTLHIFLSMYKDAIMVVVKSIQHDVAMSPVAKQTVSKVFATPSKFSEGLPLSISIPMVLDELGRSTPSSFLS